MGVAKPKINKKISKLNFTNSNRSKKQIKYLVKHYVGATGGAKANADFFYHTYRGASAHFFVGHDGEIWQVVEENDTAWHCGASSYKHKECRNSNSIGIELCVKKDKNGTWYYTKATEKAAIELFAYLMGKYEIDSSHVLRHYDVTGKICGEPDVRKEESTWKEFKQALKQYDADKEEEEKKDHSFQIKITCTALHIRKGAGTSYPVTGTIRDKKKYTIVETKSGWGKLKSGVGWICLDYTKKV